jgi:hypothetical protein
VKHSTAVATGKDGWRQLFDQAHVTDVVMVGACKSRAATCQPQVQPYLPADCCVRKRHNPKTLAQALQVWVCMLQCTTPISGLYVFVAGILLIDLASICAFAAPFLY